MGLMAAQVGRPDKTFPLWKTLLDEGPDTAPWIPVIQQRLQDIADAANVARQASTESAQVCKSAPQHTSGQVF